MSAGHAYIYKVKLLRERFARSALFLSFGQGDEEE